MAKIDDLKRAASDLVQSLHVDGLHWGCVNSFADSVTLGEITTDSSMLLREIRALSAKGATALYQSIASSVQHLSSMHYGAHRQGIPMMVLTFTDGKNDGVAGSIADVRQAIEKYNFFPSNDCFLAIAGVGSADETTLRKICDGGYGVYRHCANMDDVMTLYLQVVVRVIVRLGAGTATTETQRLSVREMWAFVEQHAAVGPIDYVLNLDRSGSMAES